MIRKYSSEDKELVRKLYSDLSYLEPTFSKLDDPHYKKFLYFDEKLLGIIIVEISYLTLNIYNIHVNKDSRGKKIGSTLINFSLEYAKNHDLHGVRVSTTIDNELAQRFYVKENFNKVGEVMNYDVEDQKAIFFYKSVN